MEKIAIIGVGRLGLCLALNLEACGYSVLGIDLSQEYVDALNQKKFQSNEAQVTDYLKSSHQFRASTELSGIFEENIKTIFIVVSTPSLPTGEFSHAGIDAIIGQLAMHGKRDTPHHLIINSTCMPGYCSSIEERLKALNYSLTYNPEFIAQGSIIHDQQFPDQVLIGGSDAAAIDSLRTIYGRLCKNSPRYCVMSLISAEITKLATNCFLTTKIAFANAIGDIAQKAGAEPEKILEAIGADSRIGTKYLKYGFGYGGPCFPRDNKAFTQFANQSGSRMLISEATDKANEAHHLFLTEQWQKQYEQQEEIVFESVTYKKGSDILEASQQLKLAEALARSGKKIIIRENPDVIKQLIDLYGNLFIYQVHGN